MTKFLKYWLPVIAWAGVIFTFSAIPNLKTDLEQDFLLRKIAHMVEFGILAWLFFRALKQEQISFNKILICSFIFSVLYAFSDEIHQLFVRGRHCSLIDVGIDTAGIFIFCVIWYIKNRKKVN